MEVDDPGGEGVGVGCCARRAQVRRWEFEVMFKKVDERPIEHMTTLSKYIEDLSEIVSVREE